MAKYRIVSCERNGEKYFRIQKKHLFGWWYVVGDIKRRYLTLKNAKQALDEHLTGTKTEVVYEKEA